MRASCPCGSQKIYMKCCRPFHTGKGLPITAEALMRSRYSAYAKGRWAYLSATVAERAAEGWRVDASAAVKWLGLEVIDVVRGGVDDDYGEVDFAARYSVDGDLRARVMRERSVFKKLDNRWYYVDRVRPSLGGESGD